MHHLRKRHRSDSNGSGSGSGSGTGSGSGNGIEVITGADMSNLTDMTTVQGSVQDLPSTSSPSGPGHAAQQRAFLDAGASPRRAGPPSPLPPPPGRKGWGKGREGPWTASPKK